MNIYIPRYVAEQKDAESRQQLLLCSDNSPGEASEVWTYYYIVLSSESHPAGMSPEWPIGQAPGPRTSAVRLALGRRSIDGILKRWFDMEIC